MKPDKLQAMAKDDVIETETKQSSNNNNNSDNKVVVYWSRFLFSGNICGLMEFAAWSNGQKIAQVAEACLLPTPVHVMRRLLLLF